jgi:PIN domain nuclease of toxin-antitoxin system
LAETLGKMVEHGKPPEGIAYLMERLRIAVIRFDEEQAWIAASLWKSARQVGMSLGDHVSCAGVARFVTSPDYGKRMS